MTNVTNERTAGSRGPVVAIGLLAAMAIAGALVVGETQGLWKLPAERTSPAVYLLMAVGAAAFVAALLFGGRLTAAIGRQRYVALMVILAVWLALSIGATALGWQLLPE